MTQPPQNIDGTTTTNQVQYVRQQKGHSLIKHLLLGGFLCYIPTLYYAFSKNHYFHL